MCLARPRRVLALALLGCAPAPAAAIAPAAPDVKPAGPGVRYVRYLVYDDEAGARAVFRPAPPAIAALTPERGAHRQEPSRMGVFGGARGRRYGVGKVPGRRLLGRSAAGMARVLRRAVEDTCGPFRCLAHQVFVDDVNGRFRGREGVRLSRAMALLGRRAPGGGTWARRVHLYLSDEALLGVAADGAAWRGVVPALARSGGVWLEMYESVAPGVVGPLGAPQWEQAPAAVQRHVVAAGGSPAGLRFVFGGASRLPAGPLPAGCWTPVRCQWVLAEATPANRRILANGAAFYRLSARQARDWLGELNVRFPPPGGLRFHHGHL